MKMDNKIKKRWYKEFYQLEDPSKFYDFYASKRKVKAIFEEVSLYKHNVYNAVCVSILPLEDFNNQNNGSYKNHQYHIGDKFILRQHKGSGERGSKFHGYNSKFWFDVRYPGNKIYEGFQINDE